MPYLENVLKLERCPHCGIAHPFLPTRHNMTTKNCEEENNRAWTLYECTRCGGIITASSHGFGQRVSEMYPHRLSLSESIPDKARDFLNQAIDSLHAPAGAVMLTASSVDAMLKAKGYAEGSLYSRINQARDVHLITEDMATWAHEVRLDANDQRHADENAPLPERKDALRVIEFAKALAEFLFVLPARVTRGLQKAQQADETEQQN